MRLVNESGRYFLDENGRRVEVSAREISLFRTLDPMARKLALRTRAAQRILSRPDDPEIPVIMAFSKLPAAEWAFAVPD